MQAAGGGACGGAPFSAYLENILMPVRASDLDIEEGKSGERIPASPPLHLTSSSVTRDWDRG